MTAPILSAYARPPLPDDPEELPARWTHLVAVRDPQTGRDVAAWGRRVDGSFHQWEPTELIVAATMRELTGDPTWGWDT